MMVEEYLTRDDRCVSPLGSTELDAYLSLSVDSILAEPLGVPVFPALATALRRTFARFREFP